MPHQTVVDELACRHLVHTFYRRLDNKDYDELAALFLPDGVWNRLGTDLVGPREIREAMQERSDWITAHVVTNLMVDLISTDTAETSQYITLYRSEGNADDTVPAPMEAPLGILWHRDTLQRTATGWRFRLKTSRALLVDHDRVRHYRG